MYSAAPAVPLVNHQIGRESINLPPQKQKLHQNNQNIHPLKGGMVLLCIMKSGTTYIDISAL